MLKLLGLVSLVVTLLFQTGCGKVSSEDLRSSGFYASMSVDSYDEASTQVLVCLSTGPELFADQIELSSGDRLTAVALGISKSLNGDGCYQNDFEWIPGNTQFVISLERDNGVSMPNSRVTLPHEYEILSPQYNHTFYAGQTMGVTWSPAETGDQISVSYSGYCQSSAGETLAFGQTYSIADSGAHSVDVSSVLNSNGTQSSFDRSQICEATISLDRSSLGVLDPNYGQGGRIESHQIREVQVLIQP